MVEKHEAGPGPALSIKTRLKAWWEGYDLDALKRRSKDGAPAEDGGAAANAPPPSSATPGPGVNRWGRPLWTANRIEVAEQIWGSGFNTPGGADQIPYLVRPLGLNPAMSVLDLSAGLGGTSRTMAGKYGCWVTGLEASPLLAKEGMQRSVKAGLAKQAPIEVYDPENFSYNRRVDAIVYKDSLFTVRNKDQLFDGMEVQLKPRGQMLLTDYILDGGANMAAIMKWADKEPQEPNLWTREAMTNAFAQRNLDLRIAEDLTDTQRSLILTAIQRLVEHLEKHSMDHGTKLNVVDEVEFWVRRVAALDQGLRVYRFYAIKPAE